MSGRRSKYIPGLDGQCLLLSSLFFAFDPDRLERLCASTPRNGDSLMLKFLDPARPCATRPSSSALGGPIVIPGYIAPFLHYSRVCVETRGRNRTRGLANLCIWPATRCCSWSCHPHMYYVHERGARSM